MTDNEETVAVIIAAHNASAWISETLGSVMRQTHSYIRCFIVDDGSTDDTLTLAEAFAAENPQFQVIRRSQGGVSAARNTGLEASRDIAAEYTIFLDSDDLWIEDALERLIEVLRHRPDAVAATATAELIDEESNPVAPGLHPSRMKERLVARKGRLLRVAPTSDTTFETLAVAGRIWPPATALLRTSEVVRVGGFDEDLAIAEDWDFFIRLSRFGPFAFLDHPVALYRRHAGSVTSSGEARAAFFLDTVRRKTWEDASNTPAQRKVALNAWRTVQLHAASERALRCVRALRKRDVPTARWAGRQAARYAAGLCRNEPPLPDTLAAPSRVSMIAVVQPKKNRRVASQQNN